MRVLFIVMLTVTVNALLFSQNTTFIHVDQFGYLPESEKVAVLADPQEGFNANLNYSPSSQLEVREAQSDDIVWTGSISEWNGGQTHSQSGDRGWWFDFSEFATPGDYYIYDPVNDIRSHIFQINVEVYQEVLKAAGRMFYYNRCNVPKPSSYAGEWADETSFLNPLQDANCRFIHDRNNVDLEKDLSGGWFDAGDYNKYVSFTRTALHNMLSAYEENPLAFSDEWNIPESGNDIPDLLDEIKLELDWLMKMTNADGSVHNKIGSQNHQENAGSPPSINTDQRFYGPTCTSASLTVASVFAHAAIVYSNITGMESYAANLEDIAISCFDYVSDHVSAGTLEEDCDDGSIVAGDADMSSYDQIAEYVTAAVYLYDLTDETSYHSAIQSHAMTLEQISSPFWGPYYTHVNDALIHYAMMEDGEPSLQSTIFNALETDATNNYNGYYGFNRDDLYRSYMPDWSYHWGSNQPKASYACLNYLLIHSGLAQDETPYQHYIDEAIHYFHGVNPLGVVYLSNMYDFGAEHSVNQIYHAWFYDGTIYDHALDSEIGPAPGYVTGGPNSSFSLGHISPPANQPVQKSYLDFNTGYPDNSWEITEPAIYYQAAYIRMLAHRVTERISTNAEGVTAASGLVVTPNPTQNMIYLNGIISENYTLFDEIGRVVRRGELNLNRSINLQSLTPGIYFLRVGESQLTRVIKQ